MKLLLATDGSKYAEEAAWLLSRLPHTEKLDLTVLYVSNMPNLQGVGNATELLKQFKNADKEKGRFHPKADQLDFRRRQCDDGACDCRRPDRHTDCADGSESGRRAGCVGCDWAFRV